MSPPTTVPCRSESCRLPLFFVQTAKGHAMPVDASTAVCGACDHPFSAHGQRDPVGESPMNDCVGDALTDPAIERCGCPEFRLGQLYDSKRMTSHFATCRSAPRFRRDRKGGGS